MFCPYCGKPLSEGSNYCANCGSQVSENPPKRAPRSNSTGNAAVLSQLKLQVARLTHFDFLLLGMQLLAVILGLFFPMVQRLQSSGKVDFKLRGIFRAWSYIDYRYNYDSELELLHNSLQFVGIIFLFVAIFLIGFALLREKRKLCALGMTASYIIYGIVVLRMVGGNYYSYPRHEDFVFTPEFWFGVVLLVVSLILTFGLHRNFKNISKLVQESLDEHIPDATFIKKKKKQTRAMSLKACLLIIGIVFLILILFLSPAR